MPQPYPKDRFDGHPPALDRVGAHRAPSRKGRGWIAFWWALAATVLLIAIGVGGLFVLNNRLTPETPASPPGAAAPTTTPTTTPTATPAPTPSVQPTVDPNLTVSVLNGTLTMGLAGAAGDALGADGWTVGALGDAGTTDVAETIVYFADPALEGAALGVAESLPGADILLSDDFANSGADLTVVVGSDYAPPES